MSIYITQDDDVFSTLKDFDPSTAVTEPAGYDPVWNEFIRLGGIVQGGRNRDSGHMTRIQKLSDVRVAGKMGGEATVASGKGSFGDREQRLLAAKVGGSTQGKKNAESGHLSKISQEYWDKVRRGEIVRKPRKKKI
jgi:hypothetical protein